MSMEFEDGKNYKNTAPSRRIQPINCPRCGSLFKPTLNRGKRKIHCSAACMKRPRKTTNCGFCGANFESKLQNTGKWSKYCSRRCANAGQRDYVERVCAGCGKEFSSPRHRAKRAKHGHNYCSKQCHYEHASGERSSQYKGGKFKTTGSGYVLINLGGKKWRCQHRLAVERVIGRKLKYKGEPILHINGRHDDNRIENLYVCSNYSEMARILTNYDVPYPVESNVYALV